MVLQGQYTLFLCYLTIDFRIKIVESMVNSDEKTLNSISVHIPWTGALPGIIVGTKHFHKIYTKNSRKQHPLLIRLAKNETLSRSGDNEHTIDKESENTLSKI